MKKIKSFIVNYLFKAIFWMIVLITTSLIIIFISQQNVEQNSTTKPLIDGIISGVVTALILFIVQVLWKKNFLIFIENLLYQDVKIEGEWNGFIVPFIGLEELDNIQKEIAWHKYQKMREMNSLDSSDQDYQQDDNIPSEQVTTATIYDENTGKEENLEAEIIYNRTQYDTKNIIKEKTSITISVKPIIVRAELKRNGHKISGKIIEIGGASYIHTYDVQGSFKNLILTASYESTSDNHIDRGALSLMLIKNGSLFEGFFSSYNDNEHCMSPMKCYLYKINSH